MKDEQVWQLPNFIREEEKKHANPWLATVTSGLFNRLDLVAAEFRHEVSE